MKKPTYAALARASVEGHPVDAAVRARAKNAALQTQLARVSNEIVRALGLQAELWIEHERLSGDQRAVHDATYFDVGVEFGWAAARAKTLRPRSRAAHSLASRLWATALESQALPDGLQALLIAAFALAGESPPNARKRTRRRIHK